jgi:hypothetical protein
LCSADKYYLCQATRDGAQAEKAFTSKGNDIRKNQLYCEVQFFTFERENENHEHIYRLELGKVCVPCSAFVYEPEVSFARVDSEQVHYLSPEMHQRICSNDELQLDTDDEEDGNQEEEEEAEEEPRGE